MNRTPIQYINRDSPRVTIVMQWGNVAPQGEILLYVRRVGDPAEFAVYPPIAVSGSELLFQFDDLLFIRKQGRYEGRLVIGASNYGSVQLEYSDPTRILSVEK